MFFAIRFILVMAMSFSLFTPGIVLASKKTAAREILKEYISDLKKNPADKALREKIIKLALTMRPAPALPEEAERRVVRGTTFFSKATDNAGYKKAITEFELASNAAPWLAVAYYNLGVAQEKAGLYADAIQNLRLYLLAAPDAKNSRDVKDKIYALEADIEDLQASKNAVPAATAPPADSGAGNSLGITGKPPLDIEPAEKQLNILKMPPAGKKSKMPNFVGKWYFKDLLRGEELTIEAFEISKNSSGDLVITPPKRAADSYATVTQFEIRDKTLKLQMRWKMRSVIGYWKTETYELTMSEDGKTLSGSHNQKSVGGRNIDMDRSLFRQ